MLGISDQPGISGREVAPSCRDGEEKRQSASVPATLEDLWANSTSCASNTRTSQV